MSGHSKWHNIQKTKGAADAKRAQAFTKIAREMIVAVKEGGSGDPNNNSRLATVIAKAKAANMPNDNIKRTIEKALGSGNTDNYERVTYEGYGPSGVALIVEDEELDEDTVMMDALEAGADDFEAEGETMTVYTATDAIAAVAAALEAKGYKLLSAQEEMIPQQGYIKLTNEDDAKNMQKMLDMFEENEDVQNVWHNWEDAE